jgi:phosphoribosylformimino-5-aminoimidazole carboxamide ribotide isomerase
VELLPAIDLRGGGVVRLRRGLDTERTEYALDPLETLLGYGRLGVERVHVVDLDAAFGEPPQRELIERLATHAEAPRIELGGGLRDREAVEWAFSVGVERAVVTSLIVRDLAVFADLAEKWPQRMVAALDVQDESVRYAGWTESAPRSLDAICADLSSLPLAAVLVTDIDRDGTLEGPNIELAVAVAAKVGVGGLLSGGVRSLDDLSRACAESSLSGAIVGKALYDGAIDAAEALALCRREGGRA